MPLHVSDWWDCVPSDERFVLNTLITAFDPPVFSTSCALVNIAATGVGLVGDRRLAFDANFRLTYVDGLPFPPPADCIVTGEFGFWVAIFEYIDEHGMGVDPCRCPQIRQPGQQGGSWPDCWP